MMSFRIILFLFPVFWVLSSVIMASPGYPIIYIIWLSIVIYVGKIKFELGTAVDKQCLPYIYLLLLFVVSITLWPSAAEVFFV